MAAESEDLGSDLISSICQVSVIDQTTSSPWTSASTSERRWGSLPCLPHRVLGVPDEKMFGNVCLVNGPIESKLSSLNEQCDLRGAANMQHDFHQPVPDACTSTMKAAPSC